MAVENGRWDAERPVQCCIVCPDPDVHGFGFVRFGRLDGLSPALVSDGNRMRQTLFRLSSILSGVSISCRFLLDSLRASERPASGRRMVGYRVRSRNMLPYVPGSG